MSAQPPITDLELRYTLIGLQSAIVALAEVLQDAGIEPAAIAGKLRLHGSAEALRGTPAAEVLNGLALRIGPQEVPGGVPPFPPLRLVDKGEDGT